MHIELHYLPCIEYFTVLKRHDQVYLDIGEIYQKQSYRNRCYILGANKVQLLSIPVLEGNKRKATKDIKIDYSQKWMNLHIRGIQSAYGKAPFFEYYFDYFLSLFNKKYAYLHELSFDMLTLCLKLMQIDSEVILVDDKKNLEQAADNQFFNQINRKIEADSRNFYIAVPYNQLFGKQFVPNLSIIDLLFCEGPNSAEIVHQSTVIAQ